jgi:uncharacterized protein YjdB
MFGLFLLLTVTMPFIPNSTVKAQASDTGKNDSYRLNLPNISIAKGDTRILKVYNLGDAKVRFRSSDEEIASVNDDGVVYAKRVGDAVITVTVKDGSGSSNLTCDVSVGPAAVSVKWTKSIVILSKDDVDNLKVIMKPSNTPEDAKFSSSNTDVATISHGGRITSQAFGFSEMRAYIDATDSDGSRKYDSCGVIVVNKDEILKVQNYFDDHTELAKISDRDLFKALDKFFNKEYDSSSSLVTSLSRYLNKEFNLN